MQNQGLKYTFRQFLIPVDYTELTNSRRQNRMIVDRQVLQAIGDISQPPVPLELVEKIIKIYKSLGFIIKPSNSYLLAWNFIITLIILFYMLQPGMIAAFGNSFWQDELHNYTVAHVIFIFVLTADIILSPLKSYYDEGILIIDIRSIFFKYTTLQFWVDIIGLISIIFPLLECSISSNWIKILWIVKIYTLSKINHQFQRVTQLYIGLNTSYLVIKLITFCYIYAHYMSIGFFLVSKWVYTNNYYGPNTPNICWVYNAWAFYQMTLLLDWLQMYTYIMYYGIAVVTTIAYGDITPKNPIECIYTIFALIIVVIIFGYLLTEILRVLINVFSYNYDRKHAHFEFVNTLKNEKVQRQTQIQIRSHTNEIDRQQHYRNRNIQQKIMNFLPQQALYNLLTIVYQSFLTDLGIKFAQNAIQKRNNFNKSLFLEMFMKQIKQQRHYIGDIFYKFSQTDFQSDKGHSVYYFTKDIYQKSVLLGIGQYPTIKNGKIINQTKNKINSFQITKVKSIFGQTQFFTGQQRSHWAYCLSNCVIFTVNRKSLLNYYNLLTQQQRQIILNRIQICNQQKCIFCLQSHKLMKCYYLFFIPQNLIKQDKKVRRRNKKIQSHKISINKKHSWIQYKNISNIHMTISTQYLHKLLINKANQALFTQYQLIDHQNAQHDQDFETMLNQTEIMVQRTYQQFLDQYGRNSQNIQYDKVFQYQYYRPHNNINNIIPKINNFQYRITNLKSSQTS